MIQRRATLGDAGAVADVYLAARAAASPGVAWAHTDEDVRRWIAGVLIPTCGMTVVVDGLTLHGYIAMDGEWVNQSVSAVASRMRSLYFTSRHSPPKSIS